MTVSRRVLWGNRERTNGEKGKVRLGLCYGDCLVVLV